MSGAKRAAEHLREQMGSRGSERGTGANWQGPGGEPPSSHSCGPCRHYGERPTSCSSGGLVPAMLCSGQRRLRAGTTDVDVQVDAEIAGGAPNMPVDWRSRSRTQTSTSTPSASGVGETVHGAATRRSSSSSCSPTSMISNRAPACTSTTPKAWGREPARDRLRQQRLRTAEPHRQRPGLEDHRRGQRDGLAGFLLAKERSGHGRHKARITTTSPSCCCAATRSSVRLDRSTRRRRSPATRCPSNFAFGHRGPRGQLLRRPRPGRRGLRQAGLINNPEIDPPDRAAFDARLAVAAFTERCWAPSLDDQPGRSHGPTDGVDRCIPAVWFADPALISRSVWCGLGSRAPVRRANLAVQTPRPRATGRSVAYASLLGRFARGAGIPGRQFRSFPRAPLMDRLVGGFTGGQPTVFRRSVSPSV